MPKSQLAATKAAPRKRRDGPRAPSSTRGRVRYAALLDATDELLRISDPDSIGLYQIAECAGVPPASVYHFLPTKEAAFLALVERYLRNLMKYHRTPVEADSLQSWQDLERLGYRRAVEFINANPSAMKILYGGYGSVETRKIDKLFTQELAKTHYQWVNLLFHMPYIDRPEEKYEITLGIFDAILEISVRNHGSVTDHYLEEACSACIAYQRLFLPERVERREILAKAASTGELLNIADLQVEDEMGVEAPPGT